MGEIRELIDRLEHMEQRYNLEADGLMHARYVSTTRKLAADLRQYDPEEVKVLADCIDAGWYDYAREIAEQL